MWLYMYIHIDMNRGIYIYISSYFIFTLRRPLPPRPGGGRCVPLRHLGRSVKDAEGKTARRGGTARRAGLGGITKASSVLSRRWTAACPSIASAAPT